MIIGGAGAAGLSHVEDPAAVMAVAFSMLAIIFPVLIAAGWLYEGLMISSSWQATIGKRILGLRVTDDAGNRIAFGCATARHFSKILSAMIFYIGFIMAAFTDRKKALHDMIAGTLVLQR